MLIDLEAWNTGTSETHLFSVRLHYPTQGPWQNKVPLLCGFQCALRPEKCMCILWEQTASCS